MTEPEQHWALRATNFLRRADRVLIGTAGVEADDDNAIDEARGLILAAQTVIAEAEEAAA